MDKSNWVVIAVIGLIAWVLGLFGKDGRSRSLAKARRAKRMYARKRKGSRSKARPARRRTKAELRAIRLRNLAKARRAKKSKR